MIRLKNDNEYREKRENNDVQSYNFIERANNYIRSYMKNVH